MMFTNYDGYWIRARTSEEAPFTAYDLFKATAVKGWGYREVWARGLWELQREYFEGKPYWHSIRNGTVNELQARFCQETGRQPDNHQTFKVRLPNGTEVYVLFHDFVVLIGRTAWNEITGEEIR